MIKKSKAKPFKISKQSVMAAWASVKSNKGTYGIDEESIEDFESNLQRNLYKVWNRMSSGSYFPSPIRTVEIPKSGGGKRVLGIPTVADRIAQTVVKETLEPILEPKFHGDSYGYRPDKSPLDAVGVARKRCWRQDWCIDLDIKGFFDNLDHALTMKAVKFHTDQKWIHLYIERWLKAPIEDEDGKLTKREKGTPQGGVISPLLSNMFMHHAFDDWMKRHFPNVRFERYVDDALVHSGSKKEAETLLKAISTRLSGCGLELNASKTKIVYCKDDDRRGRHENESFTFLGYTFRPRKSKNRYGKHFVNFSPAISNQASKTIRKEIRRWKIHLQPEKNLIDLARMYNPKVRGWMNYYGRYYRSALYPVLVNIERFLIRWVTRKFKRFRSHKRRAAHWLQGIRAKEPKLFAHWTMHLRS